MTRARRTRLLRRAAWAGLAVSLVAGTLAAPVLLRDVELFRVRTVEVHGTRFLDPYTVVRAAGIDDRSSVFDDSDVWRQGVETVGLVRDAEVRRRLPSTVSIHVREVEPVALAGPALRAVDASGRVMPLDPAGAALDLPLLAGVALADGRVAGAGADAALATLVGIRRQAPELSDRVSQVEADGEVLRLFFRDDAAEVLLPLGATDTQLSQLRLAYADLAARGELGQVRRIDLRFRDQVVVSFLSSPVS